MHGVPRSDEAIGDAVPGRQSGESGGNYMHGFLPHRVDDKVSAPGRGIDMTRGQREVDEALKNPKNSGNGSLMRVAPIGLAMKGDVTAAVRAARDQSDLTHPSSVCGDSKFPHHIFSFQTLKTKDLRNRKAARYTLLSCAQSLTVRHSSITPNHYSP